MRSTATALFMMAHESRRFNVNCVRKYFFRVPPGHERAGGALAATDPTMHQVYQAAEAGRFSEAQGMMDQVLRDHPNSAKAHFVEAELLAKQGRLADAAAELGSAQRLAPGWLLGRL